MVILLNSLFLFPVRASTQTELTSQGVKKEVEQHLEENKKLEETLPVFINIGAFTVRVESVRQALCNKRKALAKSLQDQLALRLYKQIEDVSEFSSLHLRLFIYCFNHCLLCLGV